MARTDPSEVLRRQDAAEARLSAIEKRLSAMEARASAGRARPPAVPAPSGADAAASGESPAAAPPARWGWAAMGLIAVAVAAGVFLGTRGRGGEGSVDGTVRLGAGVQTKPTDVLYVIARQAQGPPLAVHRVASPRFPLAYALTSEDVMIEGQALRGEVSVIARLSRGGDAQVSAGDVSGAHPGNPVHVGTRDVDIVLDRVHE